MTIYLATNADGKGTEGIGAMAQYQMACYAASRKLGVKFAFFGFKNLTHYQYFDITQEKFCDDINNFFSFPNEFNKDEEYEVEFFDGIDNRLLNTIAGHDNSENIVCFIAPKGLMNFLEGNIEEIESNGYIKELKNHIKHPTKIKKPSGLQVSIHVRALTRTDCDPNPIRDLYDGSPARLQRLVNLVQYFLDAYETSQVHIHSQGSSLSDFHTHVRQASRVHVYLDEYPIDSLYRMLDSDILVVANSSLSYIAHLYGKPITLVRDNFYHKMYGNTIYLDSSFAFDKNKLDALIQKL